MLGRRPKGPLMVLLAVDAALAVAGVVLLRSGLAASSAASAPSAAPAPAPAPEPTSATSAPPAAGVPPTDVAGVGPAVGAVAPAVEPAGGAGTAAPEPEPASAAVSEKSNKKKRGGKASDAGGPVDPYATGAPATLGIPERVANAFASSQPEFQRCFNLTSRGARPVDASVTVEFQVMVDGSLGDAKITKDRTGIEGLGNCVRSVLAKISLGRVDNSDGRAFVRRVRFAPAGRS